VFKIEQEREYVQVHRDTTVLSLTLAPKLAGGVVVWEDSPLVRAVQFGRVLVIDEADKAPLEVVVVLRSLLQDGDMMLADGRRCARAQVLAGAPETQSALEIHPGFRVLALANRPGFPFLGNNFFARVGDCFAAHIVGNVDEQSELHMLKSYGPSVPQV
jgi:MoxR-like ATPase